jgi:hypothetical protein
MGCCTKQFRQRTSSNRRAGVGHEATTGCDRSLPGRTGSAHAGSVHARLGHDAAQFGHRPCHFRPARVKHTASAGGDRGVQGRAGRAHARAHSARVGQDSVQSRQRSSGSWRAGVKHAGFTNRNRVTEERPGRISRTQGAFLLYRSRRKASGNGSSRFSSDVSTETITDVKKR